MINSEESLDRLRSWLRAFAVVAGITVIAIGVVVMFGWHIGSRRLVQVVPTFAPMQYNTALCFVFCGSGLLLLVKQKYRATTLAGAIAACIGGLTLLQDIGGFQFGIDQLLMKHGITTDTPDPGRMAPNSAACFLLTGICLALRPVPSPDRLRSLAGVVLASIAMGLGVLALSGYFANIERAYSWGDWTAMAVQTSIGFVILSSGLLTLLWSQDIDTDTRLPSWTPVPIAVAVLTATFCFWQALAAAGQQIEVKYPELTGVTHLATLILCVGILLALTMAAVAYLAQKSYSRARQLDRANLSLWAEIETRKEAERALAAHRDNLEIAVAQRTRELEAARHEAESANRAKSEFLSHMSHELRTPLNGILGYAQILQHHAQLEDDQRQQLDAIVDCGDHLLSLINDVLDLSKIEAERVEVDLAPVELTKLIHGVADMLREPAQQKGISLRVEMASDVPPGIVTDGAKLRQILVNLVGNAVKFTRQGSVCVRVRKSVPDALRFDVIDTGIGIADDELEQIFDPFKQVEAGKAAGGTGLGLAITKNLADLLQATVSVESQVNRGSTFSVVLPFVEAAPGSWNASTGAPETTASRFVLDAGQDCEILVADDREANREVLSGMLTPVGFQVWQARDGEEALEQLRAHPDVTLALMDIRMPRVDGLEAVKAIRQDDRLKHIKVIAVTASLYPDFRRDAIEAGFDDFLGKPLRVEELFAKLEKHLEVKLVHRAGEMANVPARQIQRSAPPGGLALSPRQSEKLRAALQIKNVTALKAIGQELEQDPATSDVGKRIRNLARRFAFDQLATLLKEAEQQDDAG